MRVVVACLMMLSAWPAAAAPLMVLSFDARVSTVLGGAFEAVGGEVSYKSVAPRLPAAELATYLQDLVFDSDAEYVVFVGRDSRRAKTRIMVATSAGRFVGTMEVEKQVLTAAKPARVIARQLLDAIADYQYAKVQSQGRRVQLASVGPTFAIPENAPYVGLP